LALFTASNSTIHGPQSRSVLSAQEIRGANRNAGKLGKFAHSVPHSGLQHYRRHIGLIACLKDAQTVAWVRQTTSKFVVGSITSRTVDLAGAAEVLAAGEESIGFGSVRPGSL
jgi:hypothetical protein